MRRKWKAPIEQRMCEYFGFPSAPVKVEGAVLEAIWKRLSFLWPHICQECGKSTAKLIDTHLLGAICDRCIAKLGPRISND